MSYAYIKNVYPDFQPSKVYDTLPYNGIAPAPTTQENTTPTPYSQDEVQFAKTLLAKSGLISSELQNNTTTPQKQTLGLGLEGFEEPPVVSECDKHINHVINCTKCKSMISKQLGLDNDRLRNEELMEVFSYIVFGVFVLLLIDALKKD